MTQEKTQKMAQDSLHFHSGELAIQERLGLVELVAYNTKNAIRTAMPDQHRDFFAQLPFVILGLVDQQGYPWPIPLFGEPGFVCSPHDTLLQVNRRSMLIDAFNLEFESGSKVGLLGIELATRRRNRMNGTLQQVTTDRFTIAVDQSYGNCPKYIQTRALQWQPVASSAIEPEDIASSMVSSMEAQSKHLIERADTFFIASRSPEFSQDRRSGIDASHRGGKPGFVKVDGNRLTFPDFSGNLFFNTLGNIEADGRVGLFFPDFTTGDVCFVVGTARILWDESIIRSFEGAERMVEINAERVTFISNFMPMTASLIEPSPFLRNTGTWSEAPMPSQASKLQTSYRSFRLADKQKESDTITSFYFEPADGQPVEAHVPGQHLPIRLAINEVLGVSKEATLPSPQKLLMRSYTLSHGDFLGVYRISVKLEERGIVSKYLHDSLNIGDLVEVGKPSGRFTIQASDRPIVLLSNGVGITPMIAMLEGLIQSMPSVQPTRPVYFIHGTQNSQTQAFGDYLSRLAEQHDWLHVHRVFSKPLAEDKLDQSHDSEGRVDLPLIQHLLGNKVPGKNIMKKESHDYYLCGSNGFMQDVMAGLVSSGTPKEQIHFESFGTGTIEPVQNVEMKTAKKALITFSQSNQQATWLSSDGSLLEFAEQQGLAPAFSCRSGSCGSCVCQLESGQVVYTSPTSFELQAGEVLICCAKPAPESSSITLNL